MSGLTGERCVRAVYDAQHIRVYQAYSNAIADAALSTGTLRSAAFKMQRMTWIKPSFLWMMYRSGWGTRDPGQQRILAIDILRSGFQWALENARPASGGSRQTPSEVSRDGRLVPVLYQWDPERDINLNALPYRSLQLGLRGEALRRYVDEWTVRIVELTELARMIRATYMAGNVAEALALLPVEHPYPLTPELARHIDASDDCIA